MTRKLLAEEAQCITLTHSPLPESPFLGVHFNESPSWDRESIPLLWEMGMGIAVRELEAFHLPEPLTCKSGLERALTQVSGTVGPTAALTSICGPHFHVHQVCLLIQSRHRPGEEREK